MKSTRKLILGVTVSALALMPVAGGMTLLSADAAFARGEGGGGNGGGNGGGHGGGRGGGNDGGGVETNGSGHGGGHSGGNGGSKGGGKSAPAEVSVDETVGTTPGTAVGNPGNESGAGKAGETPNGDVDGWGSGSFGRSDPEDGISEDSETTEDSEHIIEEPVDPDPVDPDPVEEPTDDSENDRGVDE